MPGMADRKHQGHLAVNARARGAQVGVVALVNNIDDGAKAFHTGGRAFRMAVLTAVARAARALVTD
jgi:hypothetical protein